MASPTKKVTIVRARKVAKQGAARKNKLRIVGTTAPNLPLNKPNANEIALKAKSTKAKAAAAAATPKAKAAAKAAAKPKKA